MELLNEPKSDQITFVAAGEATVSIMLEYTAYLAVSGPVRVLDGGNSFNAYELARAVRRQTNDFSVMEHIHVSRAFTCYQMFTLLAETRQAPSPTLVFGLTNTFYDESVNATESMRLLEVSIEHLRRLSRVGPVIVSGRPPRSLQPERMQLFELLIESADHTYVLEPEVQRLPPRLF